MGNHFPRNNSDFLSLLSRRPKMGDGLVVDTNILISATYDGDVFFEQTNDLLDLVIENNVPLFYNVNVRAEFLEIQRRITFGDLCESDPHPGSLDVPITLAPYLYAQPSSY